MSKLNYVTLVPQEILTNIFTRLPVKSLGLCRCVSKSWDSLISDPYFIKTHVTKTSVNNIILISSYSKLMYSVRFDKDNLCDVSASKLRFSCCDSWSKVWGSYDGLVLVEDAWRTMYLLNPTTLESKKLPATRCRFQSVTVQNLYGFGYDSCCDDYAVVFMCYVPGLDKEFRVYVYMLKTKIWKRIGYSPYDHKVRSISPGIFFKGSLHWLAKNYSDLNSTWFISAFNIANQEFSEVSLPTAVYRPYLSHSGLVGVLNGCLYLMTMTDKGYMEAEFWVMKEYGVVESWIKLSVKLFINSDVVSLDLAEDNLVVWDVYRHQLDLHVSDSKQMIKLLGLPQNFGTYRVRMTFADSLVSPNNNNNGQWRR